ncbi:MAG: hypothetical protein JXA42_05080 [Anaerolineales bacterium]|nr:hypothetical protein [Anaerolineales bacterium]
MPQLLGGGLVLEEAHLEDVKGAANVPDGHGNVVGFQVWLPHGITVDSCLYAEFP